MINFNDLILDNDIEEYDLPYFIKYQVEGLTDTNKVIIRKLLFYEEKPKNIIFSKEYLNYLCELYPVYLDNLNQELKILELSITNNVNTYYIYITFEKNEKKEINIDQEIAGLFKVYLLKDNQKKLLHTYDKHPGNNNLVYNCFKYLIDSNVIDIYT
jgi:hypothetical protein